METKVEEQPTFVDTAKLALAIVDRVGRARRLLLFRGFVRVVACSRRDRGARSRSRGGVHLAAGAQLWKFIQGARVELNKVVWPTREETIQTTLVVLVVAVFGGVFFWLLDLFLLWLTTRITGQGSL